ncbi:MAG: hypothetical protein VB875_08770, partial [Pirellulales bacterium]
MIDVPRGMCLRVFGGTDDCTIASAGRSSIGGAMPVHRGILGDAEARLADSKISALPGTNGYCHE